MTRGVKKQPLSQAEEAFWKLGYKRKEGNGVIIYYKVKNYTYFDDITFCRASKRIIFYQGSEYGPEEYKMDYRLLKAILYQCNELHWHFTEVEVKNNEGNNE